MGPLRRSRPAAVVIGFVIVAALAPAVTSAPAGAAVRAPNDPGYAKQWALPIIGAPQAWTRTTGAGVRIGIVDTGIDLHHEDLADHIAATTSCIDTSGDPAKCKGDAQDEEGHGTHVSGIAAAIKDNGKGIAGVAPDARLVVAKVFKNGAASPSDVAAWIRWVVDHGARVVNLSLGGAVFVTNAAFGSQTLTAGVEYAWTHGAVPVIASGNDDLFGAGIGSSEYGNLDALVVGATGHDDQLTGYSSPTGDAKWALLAPGGTGGMNEADDIWSTFWAEKKSNQYGYLAGTSMATPHVTGAVALLLAQGLSPQQAVDRILATVDTKVSCGANSPNCRGRLNVARATGAMP